MIDTDKYTGHTPGPWLWREATYAHAVVEDRPCHQGFDSCYDDDCIHWAVAENIHDRATGLLIADAPLLLQEVKRLRGLLNTIADKALHEVNTQPNGDDSPYNNILNIAYEGVIE